MDAGFVSELYLVKSLS